MKRFIALAAAVAALSLGALTLADSASAAGTDLSGRGVLYARGAGLAELRGDGRVDIRGHGAATVLVQGAENVVARGEGHRIDLPDGSVRFVGWRGHIRIVGEDMTVVMMGGRIEFRAIGQGTAHLRGHGTYRIGDHSGRWTPQGVEVPF